MDCCVSFSWVQFGGYSTPIWDCHAMVTWTPSWKYPTLWVSGKSRASHQSLFYLKITTFMFSFYTLVLVTPNFKPDRYSSSAMSLSAGQSSRVYQQAQTNQITPSCNRQRHRDGLKLCLEREWGEIPDLANGHHNFWRPSIIYASLAMDHELSQTGAETKHLLIATPLYLPTINVLSVRWILH